MIRKFESFINKNDFSTYFDQLNNNDYYPLTKELWGDLESDGYPDEVNDYNGDYDINNYKYTTIEIDNKDKNGLMSFDEDIIEKWNDFDIELKDKYYPNYIDFIDYDNGIIYIIKYK